MMGRTMSEHHSLGQFDLHGLGGIGDLLRHQYDSWNTRHRDKTSHSCLDLLDVCLWL